MSITPLARERKKGSSKCVLCYGINHGEEEILKDRRVLIVGKNFQWAAVTLSYQDIMQ